MQVLRDREEQLDVSAHVRRLAALARRGEPLSFLVELGVLEQAIADHEAPREDGLGPIERALGAAALAAGHACLGEIAGCARALAALERIAPRLPRSALARSPEGFLHYALDPMAYAAAARAYACEVGDRQAREALVIGIRSIGTSLSAVVAAAIGARARVTLRPRGPSGARALSVTAALARAIGAHRADVLVVDEGPGVTGETFEVVARWLVSLGIEPAHVRLVPSHSRIPELAPAPRRSFLASLRSHPPAPFDPRPARVAAALGLELSLDLGEGRWRAFTGARAPSRGIFERKKLLASGRRRALLRWAGLGEHAERARAGLGARSVRRVRGADRPARGLRDPSLDRGPSRVARRAGPHAHGGDVTLPRGARPAHGDRAGRRARASDRDAGRERARGRPRSLRCDRPLEHAPRGRGGDRRRAARALGVAAER